MQCKLCGNEMSLISAGVSKKTGKPYQAFWSCKNRDCKGTAPYTSSPEGTQANPSTPFLNQRYNQPNSPIQRTQPSTEPNWDKISFGKCKHAYLVESFKKGMNLEDSEPMCEEWATASMRVLDKTPSGNSSFSNHPGFNQPLPLKDEIDIGQIPF